MGVLTVVRVDGRLPGEAGACPVVGAKIGKIGVEVTPSGAGEQPATPVEAQASSTQRLQDRRAGFRAIGPTLVDRIQMRQKQAVVLEPGDRLADHAELVTDVVEAVDT